MFTERIALIPCQNFGSVSSLKVGNSLNCIEKKNPDKKIIFKFGFRQELNRNLGLGFGINI